MRSDFSHLSSNRLLIIADTLLAIMRSALSLRHAARRIRLASALRPTLAAARLAPRSAVVSSSAPSSTPVRYHSTQPVPPLAPIPEILPEQTYDIVIIGAGPAGLALATAMGELSPLHH